jgi:hypothetical protein
MRTTHATHFLLAPAVVIGATVVVPALMPGCSDNIPPNPRVALNSRVVPPDGGNRICMLGDQEWIDIGEVGFTSANATTTPVDNEGMWMGQSVSVNCSVKNIGSSYQVQATASITGTMAGSVTFSGTLTGNKTINQEKPLHATFGRVDGTFDEADCTGTYDRKEMDVQSGKVWITLHCPMAMDTKAGRTCDLEAEVRFEKCAE